MKIEAQELELKCDVCGKKMEKNNGTQILKYCSKECRGKRYDKEKTSKSR